MRNAFLRIAQGLFAAALLFQGFEYLQNPSYIMSDMPSLNRLAPNYKARKKAIKERKDKKEAEAAKQANPKKAQAPGLRLFPELNAGNDKATDPSAQANAVATPEPAPVAPVPVAPVPEPVPEPAPAPVPEPPQEEHGNVDYLEASLTAGLIPVGFEEAQAASEDDLYVILDARDANLFEEGHIPNAVSVPYEHAFREGLTDQLKELTEEFSRPTLIYCGDKFCPKAFNLTKYLEHLGHGQVSLYPDGWAGWQENGGRVESAAGDPNEVPKVVLPATGTTASTPSTSAPRSSDKVVPAESIKTVFASKNQLQMATFIIPWLFLALGLITLMLPMGAFTWVFRICIALLFIYSGVQKMVKPATFAQNIACYMQVPSAYINQMAFVLPPLEIVAGISFLIPYFRRAGAFMIFGLLSMFIVATSMALWQGLEIDCGCGTKSKPLEWSKIAKNTIYALGCLAILVYVPSRRDDAEYGAR